MGKHYYMMYDSETMPTDFDISWVCNLSPDEIPVAITSAYKKYPNGCTFFGLPIHVTQDMSKKSYSHSLWVFAGNMNDKELWIKNRESRAIQIISLQLATK